MSLDPTSEHGLDTTEIGEDESPAGGLRTRLGRFYYHGQPVYLVQTGTYGLRTDRGYDGRDLAFWKGLIDRLSELQPPEVRFRLRIDPWAFCYDETALSPWARSADGWDLAAFDETFWAVLRGAAEHAFRKDVLVEFVLFNAGTLRLGRGGTGWAKNPFNSAVGGPLTRDPAATFYRVAHLGRYDLSEENVGNLSAEERLQASQDRFVRQAVNCLDGLDNVTWEIAGQLEGSDPVRIDFLSHIIGMLRALDGMDRVTTSSVRTPRRADHELYRLTGIDAVEFRLSGGLEPHNELVETVCSLRAFGKPVVVAEFEPSEDEPRSYARRSLWQTYVAGGHACVDGLFYEDPSALEAFLEFVSQTGPRALTYDPKLVTSRTEGLYCHGGRAGDGVLVLYITTESAATDVEASLRLAPGGWKATSVSPTTGQVLEERMIDADRGGVRLPLPPFEEDLVFRIVRTA